MSRVSLDPLVGLGDKMFGPFEGLQKAFAVEEQQAGDSVSRIVAARNL